MEPRSLPTPLRFVNSIVQTRWYCLECGDERVNEYDIRTHWKANHCPSWSDGKMSDPDKGVDYAFGSQVIVMQLRREQWISEQVESFSHEMHPGFTPTDFVAEAEIRD